MRKRRRLICAKIELRSFCAQFRRRWLSVRSRTRWRSAGSDLCDRWSRYRLRLDAAPARMCISRRRRLWSNPSPARTPDLIISTLQQRQNYNNARFLATVGLPNVQGKVKSGTCYSAFYMRRTHGQKRFYNIGSGGWLPWANDTAAYYAATHCWRQQTIGPAVITRQTYHRPN